jgi:hypothetical protein
MPTVVTNKRWMTTRPAEIERARAATKEEHHQKED